MIHTMWCWPASMKTPVLARKDIDALQVPRPRIDLGEDGLRAILATADRQLGAIYDGLPANAMLVVYTCQGDTAECRRLQVMVRGWLWGVHSLQAYQCQGCLSAEATCLWCASGR